MSGDGKSLQEELRGYPSSRPRPGQEVAYTLSALPALYQYASISPPHGRLDGEQSHLTEPPYQLCEAQQRAAPAQSPSQRSSDLVARRFPAVQGINPIEGPPGTRVTLYLLTAYDIDSPPPLQYTVMFGTQSCVGSLSKLDPHGQFFRYLLSTSAPSLDPTWMETEVPIHLRVDDDSGRSLGVVEAGHFTYTPPAKQEQTFSTPSPQQQQHQQHQQQRQQPSLHLSQSRKRKSSAEPETYPAPSRRVSQQHLRTASGGSDVPTFAYPGAAGTDAYRSYLPVESAGHPSPTISGYPASHTPSIYAPPPSSRALPYSYAGSPIAGLSTPELGASRPPSWSSAYSDIGSQSGPSLALTAAASGRLNHAHHSSHPLPANPPLIRTSTIAQSVGSAGSLTGGAGSGQMFNPYIIYPQKAVLKLQEDLDSMAENWTVQEWEAKRRLVQFQRRQSGSTIYASFHPIGPEERAANSICISCIWWEERNDFYVTSVDTIYLLESLVAVRFTVEEKNRIRRNLEGFRPLTVSKGKAESEEFFKVIMGFPAPKPRNIEKDVKVFPWKILAHALKKIVGKYSASYASTASTFGRSASPSGYASGGSGTSSAPNASPDFQGIASPASLSPNPNVSTVANVATTTGAVSSLGTADMRLTLPHVAPHGITSSPRTQTYVDHSGRTSWGLGSYVGADLAPADSEDLLMPPTTGPASTGA